VLRYHVSKGEAHHAALADRRRQRLGDVVRVEVAPGPAVRQDALSDGRTGQSTRPQCLTLLERARCCVVYNVRTGMFSCAHVTCKVA
jgi:hypothetical protein